MFVGKIIINTINIFFFFDSIESLEKQHKKNKNKCHIHIFIHYEYSTERKFDRRNSCTVNFPDHDRLQL